MLGSLALSSQARQDMTAAAEAYAEQLSDEAREYLAGRGLAGVADSARLGEVCEPLTGHQQYEGRICIPYLTKAGVVALRFRAFREDSNAKYLSMPGAQPRLYNVSALHTGLAHVAIVEGEFDALALTDAGLPAVGVAGANMWQEHYPRCFADFERVYVICDNDVKRDSDGNLLPNPGQQLAHKIASKVPNSFIITPPENHDVNEWIQAKGKDDVLDACGIFPF